MINPIIFVEAKKTRIDISEFKRMYQCNIQAHIDYELTISKLTPDEKKRNTIINPGKKYASFDEFYKDCMKEYSESNYGDIVLTDGGKEILRVASNYKPGKVFSNPESFKPTSGMYSEHH